MIVTEARQRTGLVDANAQPRGVRVDSIADTSSRRRADLSWPRRCRRWRGGFVRDGAAGARQQQQRKTSSDKVFHGAKCSRLACDNGAMSTLLIVCHCPSPNVESLRDAVARGAQAGTDENMEIAVRSPFATGPDEVLACNGLIVGTTENFGYMNGALKDFFERIYYPCLEETQGLPYALFVKAGQDGQGARQSVERIVTGLRWRPVQPALIMTGDHQTVWQQRCEELGMTMSAGLEAGLF